MRNIPIAVLLAAVFALGPSVRPAAEAAAESSSDRDDVAADRQWKEKLGLSAGQLSKFLAAMKATDAHLQPLRAELRDGMRLLQSQLSEGAPEKDVEGSLERIKRARIEISLRNEQFDAAMASLLAPSQRAKLLVWRSLGAFPGKSTPGSEAGDFQEAASDTEVEPE